MDKQEWRRGDGDFAVRVDLESLRGVFQKGIIIEPGCKAILIVDGAYIKTLPSGEYNEGGIVAGLKNLDLTRFATAILTDVGDVELRFTVPCLMTLDPMLLDIDITLVLQIDDPLLFYTNVMKARTSLTREMLEQRFGVEIQNALQEALGRHTVENLHTDLGLKQRFELGVDEHLRRTFSRTGFGFIQFRTGAYRYRGFDSVRGIPGDYYLQITAKEAELDGRKRLFEVFDRNELQTIFVQTRALEREVMRQRVRNRIVREMNPLRVEEDRRAEQMAQFLQEIAKGKLLREQELKDYARTLKENEDDALSARKFLLRRVGLQREIEYELMRLLGRSDIERQMAEAQGKARLAELDVAVAVDRARRRHDRERDMTDQLHALQEEEHTAEGPRRIRMMQIELYERMKLTKLAVRDKGERERIARKLWNQAEKLELDLKRRRGPVDVERERIEALSKASVEAILATADEEWGRIIGSLKKQKVLRDMSEEQLRWWVATRNPQLVSALEKLFESTSKQELELIYGHWLADRDKTNRDLIDFAMKAADRQEAMVDATDDDRASDSGVAGPELGGVLSTEGSATSQLSSAGRSESEATSVADVQFTIYRPKTIKPGIWYPMLAFGHLADRRPDASPDEPEPREQIRSQAEQILGLSAKEFRETTADARQAVPRDGDIVFVPQIPGVEFNPSARSFRWIEDIHREEFRLRAAPKLDRTTARGRLSVFLGSILLAEIDLAIRVDSNSDLYASAPMLQATTASPYQKIFACYSHRDTEIVRQFELFVSAIGHTYLRDVHSLRSGEAWNHRLLKLIEEADIFQLFWSRNSMASAYVRQEWEHALALNRSDFIRPTYWEEPFPESPDGALPPAALRRLHFHRIPVSGGPDGSLADSRSAGEPITRITGPVEDSTLPASAPGAASAPRGRQAVAERRAKLELLVRKPDADGEGFEVKGVGSAFAFVRLRPQRVEPETYEVAEVSSRVSAQPSFILKNRQTDRYLLLSEPERFLWERMDGHTSLQDLATAYVLRYGEFDFEIIPALIRKLQRAQLLVLTPASRLRKALARNRPRHLVKMLENALLVLERVNLSSRTVDSFFRRLYRWGGFLFFMRTAAVLCLLLALGGLLAGVQLWRQADQLTSALGTRPLLAVLALTLLFLATLAAHQVVHGLALVHYGRRVREFGFTFVHGFLPTFYVDTTEIFMASRRARVITAVSGALVHLVLGSLWFVIGARSEPGFIHAFAAASGMVQWQAFIIALYPFGLIELDGYRVLIDAFRVPTLKHDAIRYVAALARGRATLPATREEWLWIGYVVLSVTSIAAFIAFNLGLVIHVSH